VEPRFGSEILNLYFERKQALIRDTLRNDSFLLLQRLRSSIDATADSLNQNHEWNGVSSL